jgi:predicted cobalt transporter CbtA
MPARPDITRPRTVVAAAVLVGALAGLAGAVFHRVATVPRIDDAIALEEAAAEADDPVTGGDRAEALVGRGTQRGAGLFGGYALIGAVFGLFLAVAALSLRTTDGGPFRRVAVSGAILACAVTLLPWLKYPPNPPGVGDPDTVGGREGRYVLAVVLAALLLAGLAHLSARMRRAGWPDDRRVGALAAGGLAAFGALLAALPPGADPAGVPANLVWQFRLNSLTGNLLVWALLTVGLGLLWAGAARHAAAPGRDRAPQNSMPLRAESPSS